MKRLKKLYYLFIGYIFYLTNFYQIKKINIVYFSEEADWAIKYVGFGLKESISSINNKIGFYITSKYIPVKNKICHFGSQYMWIQMKDIYKKDNKIIVSFLHGNYLYDSSTDKHIDEFLDSVKYIDKIICSNLIIKSRLINWGVEKNKIAYVSLGVNLQDFYRFDQKKIIKLKKIYNLPNNHIIIGSFQKDGNGWGEGNSPKYIKGPDILCEVLKKISKEYKIHILLSGPARGYVVNFLKKNNIKFSHFYINKHEEMNDLYNLLDLYLVTSREEGGPLSIPETLACGVPIITSRVGMADEFIKNDYNGYIVDIGNIEDYFKKFEKLIKLNKEELTNLKDNAIMTSKELSWKKIANTYLEQIH